jgi:uncharacterized protein (TIGR02391 family)
MQKPGSNKALMGYRSVHSILPDAEALLALEPEELAGVVLEHLNSLGPSDISTLNRYNFGLNAPQGYEDKQVAVAEALMEAWMWLEREGIVAPKPGQMNGWYFVTRRGQQVANREGLDAFRKASLLPKGQLHPEIAQKCWATFLRGEYDTAVFQAFKEVEVAIRSAIGAKPEEYGVDLARKAFHVDTGPLSDMSAPKAEREALAHLCAGAIGSYKNPHSHRKVALQAEDAVEMIVLASHLLKIVTSRRKA